MKKNLITNSIALIITAILLFVMIGIYYFSYTNFVQTKSKLDNMRRELNIEKNKSIEVEGLKGNFNSSLENYRRIQQMFVSDVKVADFIQDVESLGEEIGLKVTTDDVSSDLLSETNKEKERLNIRIITEGRFVDSVQFIKLIESLPYKVVVSNVSMESIKDGWNSVISFSVIKNK